MGRKNIKYGLRSIGNDGARREHRRGSHIHEGAHILRRNDTACDDQDIRPPSRRQRRLEFWNMGEMPGGE